MDGHYTVKFNRGRQWVEVYLEDVHPSTFHRRGGGRWGYFIPQWTHPRRGLFGEIHIVRSRLRHDVVAHELLHLWIEWLRARNVTINDRNEESLALLYDELTRRFWRTVGEPKRRSTVTRSTAVRIQTKKPLTLCQRFLFYRS